LILQFRALESNAESLRALIKSRTAALREDLDEQYKMIFNRTAEFSGISSEYSMSERLL
jgi:hypothetical protein